MRGCAGAPAAAASAPARNGTGLDGARAGRQRNTERLPANHAVARLARASLKITSHERKRSAPLAVAARRGPFELSVRGQRQRRGGRRCRPRRGRRRAGARIGQDAQRAGGQRDIERLAGGDGVVGVGDDALHAQLRIVLADHAAGESVGITVVAVNPDFHAAFLALVHGELGRSRYSGERYLVCLLPLLIM